MPRKPAPLSDQLRRAIARSGVSRYRIAKETGVSQSSLALFVSGERGLSMEAMDAVGQYLRLKIVKAPVARAAKE